VAFTLTSQIELRHFLELSKSDERVFEAFAEMMDTLPQA
jgi:hypothetical protein